MWSMNEPNPQWPRRRLTIYRDFYRDFPCRQAKSVAKDGCIPSVSGIWYSVFAVFATSVEAQNREQTATLQTALLRIEPRFDIAAGPDTNRSAGLHSDHGEPKAPKGLVELARRRSDLSMHLRKRRLARKK